MIYNVQLLLLVFGCCWLKCINSIGQDFLPTSRISIVNADNTSKLMKSDPDLGIDMISSHQNRIKESELPFHRKLRKLLRKKLRKMEKLRKEVNSLKYRLIGDNHSFVQNENGSADIETSMKIAQYLINSENERHPATNRLSLERKDLKKPTVSLLWQKSLLKELKRLNRQLQTVIFNKNNKHKNFHISSAEDANDQRSQEGFGLTPLDNNFNKIDEKGKPKVRHRLKENRRRKHKSRKRILKPPLDQSDKERLLNTSTTNFEIESDKKSNKSFTNAATKETSLSPANLSGNKTRDSVIQQGKQNSRGSARREQSRSQQTEHVKQATRDRSNPKPGDAYAQCFSHHDCRPGLCCHKSVGGQSSKESQLCTNHSLTVDIPCAHSCQCDSGLHCYRSHKDKQYHKRKNGGGVKTSVVLDDHMHNHGVCKVATMDDVLHGEYVNDNHMIFTPIEIGQTKLSQP